MRKYAVFIRKGDDSNFEFPQMCGEEMEQTYIRMSDWYCHADDVRFALDEKDREIAGLKALLAAVRSRCEERGWWATARMCDTHNAITASPSPVADSDE